VSGIFGLLLILVLPVAATTAVVTGRWSLALVCLALIVMGVLGVYLHEKIKARRA
jgi:hypothetical protein